MRLSRIQLASACGAVLALMIGGSAIAQDGPTVRVGYWAGGVSAGIGLTLETERFLENEGLNVEYVRFGRLGEVNRALIAEGIDIAVAGGTIPTLLLAGEGVPATVILANLVADANFVVAPDSDIESLNDVEGKIIGSTPEGSTAHALVGAILERGYGISRDMYEHVGAGEGQLTTMVSRGDIDVALLRTITIASIDADLKVLGNVPQEWAEMLGIDSPPVLGLTVVSNKILEEHPDIVVKYLVANLKATEWGSENPEAVQGILQRELGMNPDEAQAYASAWDAIYFASLTDEDIESVMQMAELMREAGEFEGEVPESLFDKRPFEQALELMQ